MSLAPIALFVYNRPWHTEQTLNALKSNNLSDQSILYIFSDGPKIDANEDDFKKVNEVRNLIYSITWFKEVNIICSKENKGLALSIIEGVSDILEIYQKIIILEDDIVTSPGFLRYMNDALNLYANNDKVFHVSGYMFPVKGKLPETFFYRQTSCWGWGTWADKWQHFQNSATLLRDQLTQSGKIYQADIDGTNQFLQQLNDNVDQKIKTWAVLWHFSVFIKDGLSLHPYKSLTRNIGMDNSGSNCKETIRFDVNPIKKINVNLIEVIENRKVYEYLKEFYEKKEKGSYLSAFFLKVKSFIPISIKSKIKILVNKEFRMIKNLEEKANNLPRYTEANLILFGKLIGIVDNASYKFMYKEIFENEVYKFSSNNKKPYILDCGANIGLSIIYFKQVHPNAEIIAFEPDKKIYRILTKNIQAFNFNNVTLINEACWNEDTLLKFYSEGADGGRAANYFDHECIVEVKATRLRKYLNRKVDFLKIDIEGAEYEVIKDVYDLLLNVDKLFIEFHSFHNKVQMLPEILSLLKQSGFRLHLSAPGLTSQYPFSKIEINNNMDNQLNIYAFR